MADVKKEYEQIQQLVEACNTAIRRMDKKAHAFLKWVPLIYDAYEASSAFERDVLNYYQLLGECGGYIWHSPAFEDHLKKKNCILSHHRDEMFDCLREMRLFYAHRINADYLTPLYKLCDWLKLNEYGRLSGIIESPVFDVLEFQQNDAIWESARQLLFDRVVEFLTKYETALKTTIDPPSFIHRYKNALRDSYSNLTETDFLEYIIRSWLDEHITAKAFRNPQRLMEAKTIIDDGLYCSKVNNLKDRDKIGYVLFKCCLTDYTPETVFRMMLEKYYDQILFKI